MKQSLKVRQGYGLYQKTVLATSKIQQWYTKFNGKVYVSFSGGKDSTVLLHIVCSLYPDVTAVYCDTGLEYPEIRSFVKTIDNVIWLKPALTFNKVISKYGYPIISKEQSQYIDQYRKAKSEKTKQTRWNGNKYGRGKISEKWKYLLDAPFKISDKCCEILKKQPFKKYEKETGRHPFIGTLAHESSKRVQEYVLYGCNAFTAKRPTSKPLSIWLENDIWNYIKKNDLPYSKIYDMGYNRTGCMFCLYGHHINKTDRLELMKQTHPKQYEYCMQKLGMTEVLKWYPTKEEVCC